MFRRIRITAWMLIITVMALVILAVPVLAAPAFQETPEVDLGPVLLLFALLAFVAFVIEAVVELIISSWLKNVLPDEKWREVIQKLCASAIGVIFTISYGLDLFAVAVSVYADILDLQPSYPTLAAWAGTVVTGLAIGRGAQWFHDAGTNRIGLDGG